MASTASFGGLGPAMSVSDETYATSAATQAGASGQPPLGEFPGFDEQMLRDHSMLGRWVRSPKKFVGWDVYMEFFGLSGNAALQETEEPQEHVILELSKERMRILHRLCWRDGLDCEYTVPIDDSVQPIPNAMVARAASSWKKNDTATWVHAWDQGLDNPLHRGLRTEQKMTLKGVNYALRYWRSLIRPGLIRVNVEVTYADTGAYAVHTQRFFDKIDVDHIYAMAHLSPMPSIKDTVMQAAVWTHDGRAVRLVVLPHAANVNNWDAMSKEERLQQADPMPAAGRSSGPFLSELRAAAREAELWVCCGLVLRSESLLLRGVALIGADGWLHGIHLDISPPDGFDAGAGDWPASQGPRPLGVYDTELGRIAVRAEVPDSRCAADLASMGAELVIVPSAPGAPASRVAVTLPKVWPQHGHKTAYELCGPEALASPAAEACAAVLLADSCKRKLLDC